MPESRSTIYISPENTERIQAVVSKLERLHVVGLRNAQGEVNKSALFSYLLRYAENNLKTAEK